MATKSYYGLSSQSVDAANANNLTSTGGGATVAQTTGTETFNFAGYIQLYSHGGSSSVAGGLGAPSGRGWILDTAELVGVTTPAGVWTALLKFFSSNASANGDLTVRFYDLNLGTVVYTEIGEVTIATQTIPTTGLTLTFTTASLPSNVWASGHYLYMDIWFHQTGGGSGTNLVSVNVSNTTSGVAGASGGFEIQVPVQVTSVSGAATGAITLSSQAATGAIGSAFGAVTLPASVNANIKLPLPTVPPQPMPLISVGVPSYSTSSSYPAGNANDNNYGTIWRSVNIPSVGTPQWLALDLSTKTPGMVLINILNEQGNMYLDPDFSQASVLPRDYQVQVNAAVGGGASAPTTGWITKTTVTGNSYPTIQHLLDMTGYNWLRIYVTASAGVSPNNDLGFQLDVHDASKGAMDRWLVLGDSITLEDWIHPALGGGAWGYGGATSQIVSSSTSSRFYPATIDGGNGGQTMSWAATNIAALLNGFSGGFVVLAFGTNDANQSFQYLAGDTHVTTYYSALLACIDAAQALNNVVIVPKVPFGTANLGDLGYNANLFNQYVDTHLRTDRPGVYRGPDFWTYFNNNQSLIRDGIHPTYTEVAGAASGHEQMHLLYADWMVKNIYVGQLKLTGVLTLNDYTLKGTLT